MLCSHAHVCVTEGACSVTSAMIHDTQGCSARDTELSRTVLIHVCTCVWRVCACGPNLCDHDGSMNTHSWSARLLALMTCIQETGDKINITHVIVYILDRPVLRAPTRLALAIPLWREWPPGHADASVCACMRAHKCVLAFVSCVCVCKHLLLQDCLWYRQTDTRCVTCAQSHSAARASASR